jgi:beta-phosphoglucomutase-like phosphatase (HAD superfamily)
MSVLMAGLIPNMNSSPLLVITFEIDGALVDSNELHVDCWERGFRRVGTQFFEKMQDSHKCQKKAPRIFQRSAFVSRRGCAIQPQ